MGRAAVAGATLAGTALLLAAPSPQAALAALLAPAPGDLAGPLVAAAALAAWLLAAWLLLLALLTTGTRLSGAAGRLSATALRCAAPATVRRAVALAVGVGVALGSAGPAGAAPAPRTASAVASAAGAGAPAVAGATSAPAPRTAPLPATATGATPASLDWPRPAAAPAPPLDGGAVVVRPGDTLWGLAARHLPADAPPARVAATWPAWWAANRAVIGDDPALLLPGQELHPPTAG